MKHEGTKFTKTIRRSAPALCALCLGVLFAANATSTPFGTNLEGIDLSDTTEDPAYATAGGELAKEAAGGVIGTAAPLAKMTTIDGETIDLAKVYGKQPVYLKLWATWCMPCRQQMPGLERTFQALGADMEIIAVNIDYSDDEASVRAFRDKFGLTMPIVMDDGRLAKLFHVNVTPQHILIEKDVRFAYIGHAENEGLEQALRHTISGDASTNSATAAALVEADPVVRPGAVVPDRSVTLLDGKTLPLKARPGRLLAVEFFSSWGEWYLALSRPETAQACAWVRQEIEAIFTSIPTVDWLGVAGGPWATEQDLKDYRQNNNVGIPLSLDQSNDLFRMFEILAIPTIALIDSEGILVRLIGPDETDIADTVQAAIAAINQQQKRK